MSGPDLTPKLGERFELLLDALLQVANLPDQFAREVGLFEMTGHQTGTHRRRDRGGPPGTSFHLRLEIL